MSNAHETHTLEFLGRTDTGMEEWFCPTCGRHMLVRAEPTLAQTLLAEGDIHASHSNRAAGLQLAALNRLAADRTASTPEYGAAGDNSGSFGVDASIDYGEPATRDGLAPWIALLKRLG